MANETALTTDYHGLTWQSHLEYPPLRRRFLATDYHGLTRFFIPWFAEQRSATERQLGGRKESVLVRHLPRRGNSESVRVRPWPTISALLRDKTAKIA